MTEVDDSELKAQQSTYEMRPLKSVFGPAQGRHLKYYNLRVS